MSKFSKISEINVSDPLTWRGRQFLTFDIDWAPDPVLEYTIDLVEKFQVPATWFVTHQTVLLERLRRNSNFELGLHPNFNTLLAGAAGEKKNASEVIAELKKVVPEACSVRSHSLVQSERLVDDFVEYGLFSISNFYIPWNAGISLKPWSLWADVVAIPHSWQDNVSMRLNEIVEAEPPYDPEGVNVYDFHPVHVFLNTGTMSHYENCREYYHNPEELLRGAAKSLVSLIR